MTVTQVVYLRTRMRFAVLGPLELSVDRRPGALGGRQQRKLLAVLLLNANRVVDRDQLVEAIWGDRPPPSARESLDSYVYRLRKLVGHDRLPRQTRGYLLRVEPGELDADDFERLLAEAADRSAAGEHRAAVTALDGALGLWRGPAWVELLDDASATAEAQRLDELRLCAIESRIDAKLAVGAGAELVPELEQLVADHPLRDGLLSALMLALYRAGRQTEALDAFQAARHRLIDELGLEAVPELYELQRRILQHDPSLGRPPRLLAGRVGKSRGKLIGGVVLAFVGVIAVVFALDAGGAKQRPLLAAGDNGIFAVDAQSGQVSAATALASAPTALTTGAGSVWVADASNGAVSRIDATTGVLIDRIVVGGDPTGIVAGGGAVWVADTVKDAILRIDPTSETVTQSISLSGTSPSALAFGRGRLWVADSADRTRYEVDPATGKVVRTVSLPLAPSVVAFGAGAVWIAGYDAAEALKLDPRSGHVAARVAVGTGPTSLAFAAGDLWVANSLDSTVSRIDPVTLRLQATIAVGGDPEALLAGPRLLWVADGSTGSLVQVDVRRDAVTNRVHVGGLPTSLADSGGRVWVGVAADPGQHRGGTLQIAAVGPFVSFDPAFFNLDPTPQFPGLLYDTLVTFDHTGGAAGQRLVPDLALNIPTPTDSGRTYTFRIRPGIRYSNGVPLRAADLRRAFERLFRVNSPGADYYSAIVGAAACTRRPAECDLARGIITNNVAGTVVFHLTAPDPEFLDALTEEDYSAPVPPGTPDRDTRMSAFPGTGPYRIVRSSKTEIEFVRNAFFHEWSHAAQPAGNPDVIQWHLFDSPQAAADAVVNGQADWLNGLPPASLYRRLAIRSPTQLHSEPLFSVAFFQLNTHLAPFNNVLVRRALNLAVDRNRIANMWGGAAFASPVCQPLAPGLPGFRRYCPYTAHPDPAGSYTGANLTLARRLVKQSGTTGEHVTVWGIPVGPFPPPQVPRYVASILRSLGYRATVRLRPFQDITHTMRTHFQMSTDGDWLADYPDPSSYLPQFFGCDGGNSNGYVCNPALDREMQRAAALEQRAPATADAIWAAVDRKLTNQADWVPTLNNRDVDLVSRRLRNYEFNPVWGFLPDEAWIN